MQETRNLIMICYYSQEQLGLGHLLSQGDKLLLLVKKQIQMFLFFYIYSVISFYWGYKYLVLLTSLLQFSIF